MSNLLINEKYTCMRRRRKIIYIVNPISGTSSKDSVQNIIATQTLREGISFEFIPSVASGDYSFLHNTIIEEKITDVVIVGGDGTVSQVIDSLKMLPVQFGIVPAGSGNGLAFGAGIARTPRKALEIIFKNYAVPTDGFRVNKRFACMLCGLGFDAKVAHDFASKQHRGLITYVQQVFKNFFDAKAYSFKVTIGENKFEVDAFFISIANSNQFGNNFTIAPKAKLSDGLLDIVILTDQPKVAMLYNTLMQVGGQNSLVQKGEVDGKRGIIYFQTRDILIENDNLAPMHIDGDPVETEKKIHAIIEEKCFNLLVAKESK